MRIKSLIHYRKPAPGLGLLAGLAGGFAACFVMDQLQAVLKQFADGNELQRTERVPKHPNEGSLRPTEQIAVIIAAVLFDRSLSKHERAVASKIVHYLFGTLTGGCYGLTVEYLPAIRIGAGSVYGSTVWLFVDEIFLPLFNLTEPPSRVPLSQHISSLTHHVVYGLTVEYSRGLFYQWLS